ncbi:Tryptophan synthase alpha chain [hydrothermal vent metagenome]|uniref:tryptophan synthase n=1 Tax=hydrothermal vent metagenome TaxID=652676 RepID=A0A3B0VWC8_9ZZZZ
MSRLKNTFKTLKKNQQKAMIPFITAGHPHPLLTVPAMHALVENGANILELGMPFSDPMADGIVIQQSSEQAIQQGMTLSSVLDVVSEFREQDNNTPVILMGYLNPIEKFGYAEFVKTAAKSGVDGLLIVDSPPEESEVLLKLLKQHDMKQIFLIAPTTDKQRQKFILSKASGFIYCIALKGVTGAQNLEYNDLSTQISALKSITDIPVVVGFGVKDIKSAVAVAQYGDGIVIGSELVQRLNKCKNQQQVEKTIKKFIKPITTAINVADYN